MKPERKKRAESISKKLLSEFLISNLQELSTDFGIITITHVEISNDLSYLDVSVSSLKNHDMLTKKLAEYAHLMQRLVGREIAFIKVPKIRFRYDESGEISSNIYQTLNELDT